MAREASQQHNITGSGITASGVARGVAMFDAGLMTGLRGEALKDLRDAVKRADLRPRRAAPSASAIAEEKMGRLRQYLEGAG